MFSEKSAAEGDKNLSSFSIDQGRLLIELDCSRSDCVFDEIFLDFVVSAGFLGFVVTSRRECDDFSLQEHNFLRNLVGIFHQAISHEVLFHVRKFHEGTTHITRKFLFFLIL